MKKSMVVLGMTLLAAGSLRTAEGPRVRYRDLSGRMSVTVSQDIKVQDAKPIAGRTFSFELALSGEPAAESVTITIEQAKGTYTAHGMEQRLGTRHLTGRSFPLSIGEGGRQLVDAKPSEAPGIDVGPPVAGGYSIAGVLGDTLPVLPEAPVAVGGTWTTERSIRSLEGWAWVTGRLTSRHRVTAVDRRGSRTVVTVETEAKGSLTADGDGPPYSGELTRTLRWTFDATGGRLLSLAMEQETTGVATLPQGEMPLQQSTRVELALSS